ncbi:hypothetical protein CC1G_14952 [Coprinopsis cinerea okayama7|uniref:Uncharacterized protein n=1 Tax=Coprinopsis cinerea (strain Okayama-7 / 130 / ATCC MYA-4618 / FGSC 9003) TaxID=240176 RepID=D6RP46_COPC7|nr:hypothetical protein CC1G_14952 [Coprinopsis cinerea okayama7\|eukprot:XP_002910621.1 hypothetical protein CC1G_14952 [Coprinopsis cinerea okayama7\
MAACHSHRQSRASDIQVPLSLLSHTKADCTEYRKHNDHTLNDARPRPRYSKRMGTYGGLYLSSIFRVVDGMMGSYRKLGFLSTPPVPERSPTHVNAAGFVSPPEFPRLRRSSREATRALENVPMMQIAAVSNCNVFIMELSKGPLSTTKAKERPEWLREFNILKVPRTSLSNRDSNTFGKSRLCASLSIQSPFSSTDVFIFKQGLRRDFPLQPCEQTSSTGYHDLIDNRRAGLGLVITNKLSLANGVEWITEFEVKRLVLLFSHGIMRDSHGSKTQARARSTKKDSFVFH